MEKSLIIIQYPPYLFVFSCSTMDILEDLASTEEKEQNLQVARQGWAVKTTPGFNRQL